MSLVRKFRAPRSTAPTGLHPSGAAEPPAGLDTEQIETVTGVPVEESQPARPDPSWTVAQLDAYAERYGIDLPDDALKAEKLDLILDALAPDLRKE